MSLKIWLPMNRDLRNQGLLNNIITNSGATYSSDGKLGGCYVFDGVNDSLTVGNLSTMVDTDFSFACWFYKDEWGTKGYETIFGGSSGFELESKVSSTNSPVLKLYNWGGGSCTYELSKWNHIVFIRNATETKLYLNGELKATGTAGTIPNHDYFVGSWNSTTQQNFKGKMCDVRIYDHCLSPMEVKQISQGLILHYPLNRNGWGQENLFKNSSLTDLTSTNLSTKIYYQGSYIPEITQDGLKFTWTGSSAREIDLWLDKTLKANTYYTLSFIYRNNMAIGSSFYLRKDGNLVGYWSQPTIPYSEDWSTYKCTFKIVNYQSNDATTGTLLTLFYSEYTANKWIELKQNSIKLEEGSISTPWSPASSDTLADTMGLNSTTEYDCSGFCNNGDKFGIFNWTSDTPKYAVSTNFPSGSNYINAGRGAMVKDSITVSLWCKYTTWGNPISCTEGGGWNFENNSSYITFSLHVSGVGYKVVRSTKTPDNLKGEWHMLTGVFNKIQNKIYIDGELEGTVDTDSTNGISYNANNAILIAAEASGTQAPAQTNFVGNISDLRIYATALSADDVKSLYQNCATIDPDGTIRGQIRS